MLYISESNKASSDQERLVSISSREAILWLNEDYFDPTALEDFSVVSPA